MTTSTITLNSDFSLYQFLSIYEDSPDFHSFFTRIHHLYKDNQEILIQKRNLSNVSRQKICGSLDFFLNQLSLQNQEKNRKFGRYFTPKLICRFINNRVITNHNKKNHRNRLPVILDPSIGLGFFLIDMMFLILKSSYENSSIRFNLKKIISNFYGYEIDKTIRDHCIGLILSIIGILSYIHDDNTTISTFSTILHENILEQNFLKSRINLIPDIIVGNPPYVRVHKMNKQDKEYLKSHYITAKYDFDLYVCFFERSLALLPEHGILGFITPEKYLLRKYGENLRFLMLQNCVPVEIIDISRCKEVFEVFAYPLITILKKNGKGLRISPLSSAALMEQINKCNTDNKIYFIRTSKFSRDHQILIQNLLDGDEISQDNTPKTISYRIVTNSYYHQFLFKSGYQYIFLLDPLVEKLERHFVRCDRLINTHITLFCGTPRSKYYHKVKENIIESKNFNEKSLPFIMSRNIAPYGIFWHLPVVLDHNTYNFPQYVIKNGVFSPNIIKKFQYHPKLLIKANSRNLTAAIDRKGFSFAGAYGLDCPSFLSLEVLCAIVNSNLINYYLPKKFQSYMVNSNFLSINSAILKDIPLPGKINQETKEFIPMLPPEKHKEICKGINSIVSKLESFSKADEQNPKLKTIKSWLYACQLNSPKYNKNKNRKIYKEIVSAVKRLNELVYDMYDIPQSMRV